MGLSKTGVGSQQAPWIFFFLNWGGWGGGQSGPLHEEQALTRYSGDKIWHMGLSRTGVCFQQVPCRLLVQGGGVRVGGSPQQQQAFIQYSGD